MRFSENFEAAKNMAVEAAQTAAAKAKELAAVAKANISIYAEEDKVKKAEIELGKLYYRRRSRCITATTPSVKSSTLPSICRGARRSTSPRRPSPS